MNLGENIASSISGSVDKAILCIKKPVTNTNKLGANGQQLVTNNNNSGVGVNQAVNAIDLQAKLTSIKKGGMFSFRKQAEELAKTNGYHVLKVKYNPSKISISSRAGSFIQPGPGGESTNIISQVVVPAQTYMSFEIIFDDENHQDAFMFDKFTNVSAGAAVSDIAGVVKNAKDGGYSVKEQVEAMIGMLTQSETRQVVFYWSQMVFAGEVISLDAQYTMFNSLGNPIRAVVRLSLQESEGGHSYWNNALDKFGREGSKLDKASNLLNFK